MGISISEKIINKQFQNLLPCLKGMKSFMNRNFLRTLEQKVTEKLPSYEAMKQVAFIQLQSGCFSYFGGAKSDGAKYILDNISEGKEDFLSALYNNPCFSIHSEISQILLEKYDGIGICPEQLFRYLIEKEDSKKVYEIVSLYDHYLLHLDDSLNCKYTPLYLFRYLLSHGYEDKKEELARRLLHFCYSGKEYAILRMFVSERQVKEDIDKNLFDCHLGMNAAPYYFDEDSSICNYAKTAHYKSPYGTSLLYIYDYDAFCCDIEAVSCDDSSLRATRKTLREDVSTNRNYDTYFLNMLFLLRKKDKNALKCLAMEEKCTFINHPSFYILMALSKEELEKNLIDLHEYQEK